MDGLRFTCQPGCINCCDQQGFVYLSEDDLLRAAAFTAMSAAEFEKRYVYRTRHLLRLRKPRRSQCHFLLGAGCAIHPAKPTQCRLFPYWPELVENRRAWEKTSRYCPGIGVGPLVQIEVASKVAAEMRTAYPSHYESG